jgi:hypothetical protein
LFETKNVSFGCRTSTLEIFAMTSKTLLVAGAVLLAATALSLAQSQPNFGANAPATGDSYGKPPSGAQPPLSGRAAYNARAHHARRHVQRRETTGQSTSQK